MSVYIGECGSTLYVGLQHAVPPTNTKFKPLLLPSQAGMPYTNTHKHRTSYFKLRRHFWVYLRARSPFLPPAKTRKFLRFFIINIIIIIIIFNFFFPISVQTRFLCVQMLTNLYQSVTIYQKYMLLILLLRLLKYLGLQSEKFFDHALKRSFPRHSRFRT